MREIVAVADMINGDMLTPEGWEVIGYPRGVTGLPGSLVRVDKGGNIPDLWIDVYFSDPEAQVQVIRS